MQRAPDRESPGFFEDLVKKYDSIWETFILPERTTYNQEALGPQTQRINAKTLFTREDNVSTNIRGEKIVYSFFKVQKSGTEQDLSKDVCLVYLHSHGGNMVEGLSLLKFAGELGLNFCCFDFAGSGKSEGKYTTLGLRESEDCRQIIEVLMKKHGMRSFVLWGRSMGAVAALLYASGEQPHIKYMVLDSPFSDVEQMVRDAGNSYISLGEYLAMFLFNMVKNDIKEHVGQDLGNFKPIRFCQSCKVPCLFMVGKNDPLVLPNRVEEMFTAYIGDKKEFMLLEGTHSSGRSMTDIEEAFRKIDKIFRTGFATQIKG
jgi:alpha-beta hydrolase superfamily lysophospholipase